VSAACGRTVVVGHTIKHVAGGLSESSGSSSQLRLNEKKGKHEQSAISRSGEPDRFFDLDNATRGCVVPEALEMKGQHRWECFD